VTTAGLLLYVIVFSAYGIVPGGAPGTAATDLLPGRDLTAHSLASGGLALLLCSVLGAWRVGPLRAVQVAMILAVAHAGSMELVQHFLSWRTATLVDVVASLPGILLAGAVWAAWRGLCAPAGRDVLPSKTDAASESVTLPSTLPDNR